VALNRQMVLQVMMPASLVAVAMFGMSLLGIRSINHLQADRDKIITEHGKRLQLVQDLATDMRRIRLHSYLYIMELSHDPKHKETEKELERRNRVDKDLADFEGAMG
jgi:two-component system, NtrC family, sensor histidine kinase HydH